MCQQGKAAGDPGCRTGDSERECILQYGRPGNVFFCHWLGLGFAGSVLVARLAGKTQLKAAPAGGSREPRRPTDQGLAAWCPAFTCLQPLPLSLPFGAPRESTQLPRPRNMGASLPRSHWGRHWTLPTSRLSWTLPPPLYSPALGQAAVFSPFASPASYLVSCPLQSSQHKTAQGIFLKPKPDAAPLCSEPSMAPQCP